VSIPDLKDEATINACVKDLTTAISIALADSTPKRRQGPDPRPSIPARIQDELRLKTSCADTGRLPEIPL
jgi:hypothetical protein